MSRIRFSLATFNVKNLVNAETNYYQRPDGSWNRYSQLAFKRKVDWLAQQLVAMDADHVFLQEVFHQEALDAVAARYAEIVATGNLNQDPYVAIHHIPNIDSREENPLPGMGYLGRVKPTSMRAVQDFSADPITLGDDFGVDYSLSKVSRPVSIVEIPLKDGLTGLIFNAHLKSKRPSIPSDHPANDTANLLHLDRAKGSVGSLILRAGEALALRREVLAAMRGTDTPVFVLGDLNDEGGAVTTELVKGEAPWRHEKDDAVIEGLRDVELHSAARAHLRRSEHSDFTTHIYNGHYGTIDHILLSREFYYRNPDRVGDLDYVRAFNDHLVDDDILGAPRISVGSDHGQLAAHFSMKN